MPDWFPQIVKHLLTGIVLVFIIQSMARKRAGVTKDGSGSVLGYSLWFAVLGLVVFSIFAFMVFYSFYHHVDDWEVLMGVGGTLMALGLFIFLYATFTKIEVDEAKVISRVFWRPPVSIHWMDVAAVEFTWTKRFRLQAFDGRRIHVDMMIGGLSLFLDGISRHLPIERYLDAMRDYWKAAQNYHKSVGSVLAIPPADYVKVSGVLEGKRLEDLLGKISGRVEGGFGDKEIKDVLKKAKKAKEDQGVRLESPVLFQGMPAHFFLFLYVLESGRHQINIFALPKLADGIKEDMERSGAADVLVELDEDEDEDEEALETTE